MTSRSTSEGDESRERSAGRSGGEAPPPVVVPGPPPWYEEREEVSLLSLANVLLRHRWLLLGLPAALLLLVSACNLTQPPSYTSGGSFLPQTGGGGSQLGRLAGVASQFGVSVPTAEPGQGPAFYAELFRSRALLESAATTTYSVPDPEADSARSGDLVALLGIEAPSRDRAVAGAVDRLEEAVSVQTGPETGLVEFSVTMPSPALAEAVADRLLELVNEFNVKVRQSRAREEREFVEGRLEEAREDLEEAEDRLERFLENNRRYENSPRLRFQEQRLQRQVELRQQVVTSLAQSLEEARIEAVRSTPVISVVTSPDRPLQPDPRNLLRDGLLALFLGGLLAVGLALVWEYARSAAAEGDDDYREFEELKRETVSDVVSFWDRLKHGFGRVGS